MKKKSYWHYQDLLRHLGIWNTCQDVCFFFLESKKELLIVFLQFFPLSLSFFLCWKKIWMVLSIIAWLSSIKGVKFNVGEVEWFIDGENKTKSCLKIGKSLKLSHIFRRSDFHLKILIKLINSGFLSLWKSFIFLMVENITSLIISIRMFNLSAKSISWYSYSTIIFGAYKPIIMFIEFSSRLNKWKIITKMTYPSNWTYFWNDFWRNFLNAFL